MTKVTIREIAKKANVSVNTVSRALNDKPEIAEATRHRILRIADELGYRPNLIAKGLVTRRTKAIGVIVPDSANPFYAEVIKGILSVAQAGAWTMLLANSDGAAATERHAIDALVQRQVDGLILFPHGEPTWADYESIRMPVVSLGSRVAGSEIGSSGGRFRHVVTTDDRSGAREAVRHLIASGRRRLRYVGPYEGMTPAVDRWRGFSEAVQEAGLPLLPPLSRAVSTRAGYELAMEATDWQAGDGLFAFSDLIAVGLLRGLGERGVPVPDDVAVVGYDDIELSRYLSPALTTVRIPKMLLGERGASRLIKLIEDEAERDGNEGITLEGRTKTVLATELIVRESA